MEANQAQNNRHANRHAAVVRMILIYKYELRCLRKDVEASRIKRVALKERGVAIGPDNLSRLAERIFHVRESMFKLVLMYDKITVTPNLHERAQLLGVCHIALKHHRAAISGMGGHELEQTLLTDIIQHGEIAGEPERGSIWECTARDYPLFNACSRNLIRKVKLPDDWFQSFKDEMESLAKRERRSHLRLVA